MSDRPLWHVIEDPAFVVTVFAWVVIVIMLVGSVVIYVVTQSMVDAALVSLPPIFIALIMVLAKRAIKRNEVALYMDHMVVVRGSERVELPIHKLTRIRIRPVISMVRLTSTKLIPIPNIPRLNTWSVTFLSGDEELVKVWINESELDRLRVAIKKLCLERRICINIESGSPVRLSRL